MKLSTSLKSSLYWFVEDLSKGLLDNEDWDFGYENLDTIEGLWEKYQKAILDPSTIKQVFSIWSNNIEIDEKGNILNEDAASLRAFQYLRSCFDPDFDASDIVPPLEGWEIIEHEIPD